MPTDILPGQHWACYYSRATGARVGPAAVRIAYFIAEESTTGSHRTRRIRAAIAVRTLYRVGGRA